MQLRLAVVVREELFLREVNLEVTVQILRLALSPLMVAVVERGSSRMGLLLLEELAVLEVEALLMVLQQLRRELVVLGILRLQHHRKEATEEQAQQLHQIMGLVVVVEHQP